MVASTHDEEAWQAFCAAKVALWQERVRIMLAHLDRKLQKTMSMLSDYQTEVAQWVRSCPSESNSILRNALLKNLNTQAVLLSIIDFRRRALVEDVASQLYNVLLELCTLNLMDVAVLLGCSVSSPYVTFRVMQLVNNTVEQRRAWLLKEFEERKEWVTKLVADLNATYNVLIPCPLRRSASCQLTRGSSTHSQTSNSSIAPDSPSLRLTGGPLQGLPRGPQSLSGPDQEPPSSLPMPGSYESLQEAPLHAVASLQGSQEGPSSALQAEELKKMLAQGQLQVPSYTVGMYKSQSAAPPARKSLSVLPSAESHHRTLSIPRTISNANGNPAACMPSMVASAPSDACGCGPKIAAMFKELDAKNVPVVATPTNATSSNSLGSVGVFGGAEDSGLGSASNLGIMSPIREGSLSGWPASRQASLQRASMS